MKQKTFSEMKDGEIWTDLGLAIAEADMAKRLGKQPVRECCRALRILKDRGTKSMNYFYGNRKFEVAKMNFCPECGRPL